LKKVVIFLPGVLGSTLYIGQDRVWPSIELLFGGIAGPVLYAIRKFKDPDFTFEVKNVLQDDEHPVKYLGKFRPIPAYTKIRDFFRANGFAIVLKENGWAIPSGDKFFFEFPYDWRLDLRLTARELRSFVQDHILSNFSDPEIYIVGHSMGGLLSRAYLKFQAGNQIQKIKRQVLIGTPNHGSPKAYLALKYGVGLLATSGFQRDLPKQLDELASDLPGIYELLPSVRYETYFRDYGTLVHTGPHDEKSILATYIPRNSTWKRAVEFYGLNNDERVKDALNFHQQLTNDTHIGSDQTFVIFSSEVETLNSILATKGNTFFESYINNGDGTVTERSAYDLANVMNSNPPLEPEPRYSRRFAGITHLDLVRDNTCLECLLSLIL
jgi:pimeloyl-ACP methyl ester carboxylesterase